jgi:hypothetical protein
VTTLPVDDEWAAPPPRRAAPPPVRSETARTEDVLKWLKSQRGVYAFKKHTTAQGETGHPDIFGCRYGRMVLVEMKIPGKVPTKTQMQRLVAWQSVGAAVCWATEVEHVAELFERIDADAEYRNPLTRPGAPEASL